MIRFFVEGITFKLENSRKRSSWIRLVANREKCSIAQLNYIFCSDAFLLEINQHYLKHDSFTDIITFGLPDDVGQIGGEVYISIDRVRFNSGKFKTSFQDELDRVIVHGALHLMGYNDKTLAEKKLMRKKEDAYLSLLNGFT